MRQSILISGISGRLGRSIKDALAPHHIIHGHHKHQSLEECIKTSGCDMIIDASSSLSIHAHIAIYLNAKIPTIILTSGITPQAAVDYCQRAHFPFIIVPNLSKGFRDFLQTALQLNKQYPALKITETHSSHKKDSPSGSSLFLSHKLGGVDIESKRVEQYIAKHEIIFSSEHDTITLSHTTTSPKAFMCGVLTAIEKINTVSHGMILLD